MEETQQQAQWTKTTRKILTSTVSQKDGKHNRGLCDYTTKAYNKNTDRQGCPAHLEF